MEESIMDVEEIYTILKGATRMQYHVRNGKFSEDEGASYEMILKWFKHCGIIEDEVLTEDMFIGAYERLAPNREVLTLSQMVTLFSIFARVTKHDVAYFALKFEQIKDHVTVDIREYWNKVDDQYRVRKQQIDAADDISEEIDGRVVNF